MAIIKYRQTLQAAIDTAASGDLEVDLDGATLWVKGRIDWREGVTVKNGIIKAEDAIHLVHHSKSTGMQDLTIDSRAGNSLNPIVELVDVQDTVFRNITILGDNPRTAIMCKTRANNVLAENINIAGNLGYGWLYNDSTKEQNNPDFRVFDRVDYAGEPIGSGLTVHGYRYGHGALTRAGDGFEINTPMCGFNRVLLKDAYIGKTVLGDSRGIGLGFANCTGVEIYNADVQNAARSGIHFEKGGGHTIDGFKITGGGRAISIGHTSGTTFRNGSCIDNEQWLTSYNTLDPDLFGPATGLVLEDMSLSGATKDGILIANAENYTLRNLRISDYMGSPASVIKFYQQDPAKRRPGVTESTIEQIVFSRGSRGITPEALIDISDSPDNEVVNIYSPDMPRIIRTQGTLIKF